MTKLYFKYYDDVFATDVSGGDQKFSENCAGTHSAACVYLCPASFCSSRSRLYQGWEKCKSHECQSLIKKSSLPGNLTDGLKFVKLMYTCLVSTYPCENYHVDLDKSACLLVFQQGIENNRHALIV